MSWRTPGDRELRGYYDRILPEQSQDHRPTSPSLLVGDPSIPLGTIRSCPTCGAEQERSETPPNAAGRSLRYWSQCLCVERAEQLRQATLAQAKRRQAERDAELIGDPGLGSIQSFTLASFNPGLLQPFQGAHPYTLATKWLADIHDLDVADYRSGPPQALYFYCPGKGRGKSHLAGALLLEATVAGRRVAYIEENRYLTRCWNMPLGEARENLVVLPAERAWLTVVDDLGRREIGQNKASTQNAWNDIFSRRWMRRGWTIITSNYSLEDLVERGTIDDAAYSRLNQMTRGAVLYFDGEDQRAP